MLRDHEDQEEAGAAAALHDHVVGFEGIDAERDVLAVGHDFAAHVGDGARAAEPQRKLRFRMRVRDQVRT
ncbi:hypothetical protein D3C86_1705160 [compost metagenome]